MVREEFVLHVRHRREELAGVAPLLCAGITTWSPLRHWQVGPGKKVGVVSDDFLDLGKSLNEGAVQVPFFGEWEVQAYKLSGFFDNEHKLSTGLGDYLRAQGVGRVFVCGLATDYCVKFTALDALRLGFDTYVVADACRGVEVNAGDTERALEEMRAAGAHVVESGEVPEQKTMK